MCQESDLRVQKEVAYYCTTYLVNAVCHCEIGANLPANICFSKLNFQPGSKADQNHDHISEVCGAAGADTSQSTLCF